MKFRTAFDIQGTVHRDTVL